MQTSKLFYTFAVEGLTPGRRLSLSHLETPFYTPEMTHPMTHHMTHPSRIILLEASQGHLWGIKGGLQLAEAQSSPRSQTLNSKGKIAI